MALAEKRFILEDEDRHFDITLKLCESGCFQYGNQHSLKLVFNEPKACPELWDARYDHRFDTVETFNKHAVEFIREWCDPALTVSEVN